MKLAIQGVIGLAVIWGIAGIAIFAARASRPSPQAVVAYLDQNDFSTLPEVQGDKAITVLADKMNRMDPEQRQTVQNSESLGRAFRSMTPAEQRIYLNLTLPSGMKETMEALNRMTPEQRDVYVRNALSRAGKDLGFDDGTVNKEIVNKVVAEGLAAFYSTASPDVKIQMAPVLEQLHQSLRNL